MSSYKLHFGDSLEVLPTLGAGSVDAIICDPPYGTTACTWDTVIPFAPMWEAIKHVRKPRAAVVLFGSEPFSSLLRVSNLDEYKYDLVWDKKLATDFLNAKNKPLKRHELISVFSDGTTANGSDIQMNYNPQMWKSTPYKKTRTKDPRIGAWEAGNRKPFELYDLTSDGERFPTSIIKLSNADRKQLHPTQKPVALMSYLIRTYTNPGDTVLDFTCGSGSTGVAAVKEGRNFIGIDNGYCEKEPYNGWRWVDVARERIANAAGEFTLTEKEKRSGQMPLINMQGAYK